LRKAGCASAALLLLGALGALVMYLRLHVVPPGCRDPRTLALVRESLTHRFGLPEDTRIKNIHVLAGGPLAFRFVCEADLVGYTEAELPPGPKPGFVRYTSTLAENGTRHEVTVEVLPLLMWAPAS
jgi:hypothetical protein